MSRTWPLRKVVSAQQHGTTKWFFLTLECGHEVTRQRIGPNDIPAQARCAQCLWDQS